MPNIPADLQASKLSTESIIELVRQIRDNLIKEFLESDRLHAFFSEHYHVQLSPIKTEFLKRDLKELQNSTVDLVFYSSVIKEIKEANTVVLTQSQYLLFNQELEGIFKKYVY